MWLASIAAAMTTMTAQALSPLTPRLSPDTHAELLDGLTSAGLPEVAQNSVVIAMAGALGFEPADAVIDYAQPYPQLPLVAGQVTRVSDSCARLTAQVRMPTQKAADAITVSGTYCLVGPAEWRASEQRVSTVEAGEALGHGK